MTRSLASLLTSAGYLDVRSRTPGYPAPREYGGLADMPDVTAKSLHGHNDVFYVLTDHHLAASEFLRPWRTLLSGATQRVRVWLAVPEGSRPVVQARLRAMGVRACVVEI